MDSSAISNNCYKGGWCFAALGGACAISAVLFSTLTHTPTNTLLFWNSFGGGLTAAAITILLFKLGEYYHPDADQPDIDEN